MGHLDHMIRVAGVEHVGVGSDFDGIPHGPEGIETAADLGRIPAALLGLGYTREDVGKVLGGNLLRVLLAVEGGGGRGADSGWE